jgi:hypothetical protein
MAHSHVPLLARETGLEPATSGVTGRRSNQLSYSRSGSRAQRLGCRRTPVKQSSPDISSGPDFGGMGGDGFEPPTLSV